MEAKNESKLDKNLNRVSDSQHSSINWKNLFLELLVVFIGVYGAFYLNNYEVNIENQKNKIKYFEAFEKVLNRYAENCHALKSKIDTLTFQFENDSDLEIEFNHELDFTNTIYIVESVFSSDRFSNVDSEFMMNLEFGANQILVLDNRLKEFRDKIYQARINHNDNSEEFKKWYGVELSFISKRLGRLIETIEKGALPETRKFISNLGKD